MSTSSATEPALITLDGAVKHYGRRRVLALPSLELRRGDAMLITGANGSGKSTLLRVLAGVTRLSAGSVQRSPLYESLRVCYLPQSGGLHTDLTLAANLRHWALLTGSRLPHDLARQWYMRGFDLLPFLDTPCRELSGGFQRLAALACALATQPSGLFVDEPLAGIDEVHAQTMISGLAAAQAELHFLVVTSHTVADLPSATRQLALVEGEPA